jgi:acyl carrier protein
VAGGGIIPLKTRAAAANVLAPKVMGAANLHAALQGLPLDFMMLCSSYNSIGGALGQVDYSAANAYLDAYAHANMLNGGPLTISINWSAWQEVGLAFDAQVPEQYRHLKEQNLRNGVRTSEGQEAFERILAEPLAQWVVSPVSLPDILALTTPAQAAGEHNAPEAAAEPAAVQPVDAARHARPALLTDYLAPRNAVEAQIADVWQQLFGIDRIGVNDNFFELGGHSLMATQVLVRLREHFGVDLPVRTIFEAHTIAELSSQLEIILWAAESQRSAVETVDEDREELEF